MAKASLYSEKVVRTICAQIAEGIPLAEICRQEGMPAWRTVYDWLKQKPDFAKDMEEARKLGAQAIAEECLAIADDARNDFMERVNKKTGEVETAFNIEHVQRSKLRIETRLKLLAKWHPKEYGDRLDLTSSDGSMSPPKTLAEFYAINQLETTDAEPESGAS